MSAFVLSFVYRLLEASPASAKLFLILLGGLTTFLIYLAGREVSGVRVGFLAAFLFAILPSVICYTGVLAGDHLALPFLVLCIFIYARIQKRDHSKFSYLILPYALPGILAGLVDWFRPVGILLFLALLFSILVYNIGRSNIYITLVILGVLTLAYTQTSNLAVVISERFFQRDIRSASQRIGEFLLKGLNPESKGIVTLEDDTIANQAYQSFGNDSSGAQAYLIRLAISRLEPGQIPDLFREKFNLIWSSHDALFDYALGGSNDEEFVNLLRAFETLLYLVITIFIFVHAIQSIRQRTGPAVFAMQLFILGFAFLLLLMEVQNRYVMVVIPYSILLGVMGLKDALSIKESSTLSQP
jgi:4-amino-4-deoxy-L-arabinose transferase-like glycosyltransferase